MKFIFLFALALSAIIPAGLIFLFLFPSDAFLPLDAQKLGPIPELLLVIVLAVEGIVVWVALTHDQRGATAATNSAVFDLYQMYLTKEYNDNVRRPAWLSLWKARNNYQYRRQLLAGIVGSEVSVSDEQMQCQVRRQAGQTRDGDKEYWDFTDECHRVLDILEFFSTLASLNADANVIRICNFFYDSWRPTLWRILIDLEEYNRRTEGSPRRELAIRRCKSFRRALKTLDAAYHLKRVKLSRDPFFQNNDTSDGQQLDSIAALMDRPELTVPAPERKLPEK